MSGEVRVDQHFSSAHLGNALAKLWSVNGLTLELVDIEYVCAFTADRPANPGMTEDGQVYSMGNITRWLVEKNTSPNTNTRLAHKRVMRLLPLRSVIETFFKQAKGQRGAARTQFETKCYRAGEEATGYKQLKSEVDKIDCYLKACEEDLEAWIQHIEIIRGIQSVLTDRMEKFRQIAAAQIQMKWQSFAANRRATAERHRQAAIRIQSKFRLSLARPVATAGRYRWAASHIRSTIRSFNARVLLLRLAKEQRDKASVHLLKTVRSQAGQTYSLVKAFLQRRADVNCTDMDSCTPLIFAAAHGNAEVAKLLCDAGANRNHAHKHGVTPLFAASETGHLKVVQLLCNSSVSTGQARVEIDKGDESGRTSLMIACYGGHENCSLALIAARAEINRSDDDGGTALMASCDSGHARCARIPIERGAKIDHSDKGNWTALMFACQNGHEQSVRALIEGRASLERKNPMGATALMISCEGHHRCTRALLEARANANAMQNQGGTALMVTCQSGHDLCTRALTEAKADLEKQDTQGDTALTFSCGGGHHKCARALIESKADLEKKNNGGFTAFMLSVNNGHNKCTQTLIDAGCIMHPVHSAPQCTQCTRKSQRAHGHK